MIKVIGIYDSSYEIATVDECYEYLEALNVISLDTETEGEFNFRNDLLLLQVGDKNIQYVINCEKVNVYLLKPLLESKLCIIHNAKFDWKFMYRAGIDIKYIFDTFLAEVILHTGYNFTDDSKPYYIPTSLKGVVKKYCNYDLDKTVRGIIHSENNSDRVIKYAAEDIEYLEDVMNLQKEQLIKLNLVDVADLENKVVRVFAIMEYNGIKVDKAKWNIVADVTYKNAKDIEAKLDAILLEEFTKNRKLKKFITTQLDFFSDTTTTNVNWKSSSQKKDLLKALGVKLDSTEMPELIQNQNKHRIIPLLIEYSKQAKLTSTYGSKFLQHINSTTKRIHTNFWMILNSGRVSSNNPSLLNIPAHGDLAEAIKNSFIAEEGYVLIDSDFSGIELRIIAELSQDPLWINTFNEGGDLHSILCSKTFGIPLEDVKKPFPYRPEVNYRFVQKTANFMLAYGGSEYKLAETIQVSVSQAKDIIDNFFKVVPKVKSFLEGIAKVGMDKGMIRTPPPSRVRFFPQHQEAIEAGDNKAIAAIGRMSKNHPIQGSNANITKLALYKIQSRIDLENLDMKILLPIHDAILVEANKDIQEYAIKLVQEEMIAAAETLIKSLPVKVDTVVGDCWLH